MHAFCRTLVVVLIVAPAVMAVVSASSPPRVQALGATIDRLMSRSIDIWVGGDTLHMFPADRWVFYQDFIEFVTQQTSAVRAEHISSIDADKSQETAIDSARPKADGPRGLFRPGEA